MMSFFSFGMSSRVDIAIEISDPQLTSHENIYFSPDLFF